MSVRTCCFIQGILTERDTADVLVLTTTVLLRCIAESPRSQDREVCTRNLTNMMDHLALARSEYGWELADACLERYRPVVNSVMDSLARAGHESNSTPYSNPDSAAYSIGSTTLNAAAVGIALSPDLARQIEWLDKPWDDFWLDGLFPLADDNQYELFSTT